jgi:PAS domain S-box-containing protein
MKLRLSHQGLMFVSGVLLFELVLVAIFAGLLGRSDQALEASFADISILGHIDKLKSVLTDMELSAVSPTGHAALQNDLQSLDYEFRALQLLSKDDPWMADNLDILRSQCQAESERLQKAATAESAAQAYESYSQFRGSFIKSIDRLLGHYRRPAEFFMDKATIARRITEGNLLAIILVNAVLAVGTTLFFMQGIVNRLSVVADNSVRFGRGQMLNQPLDGSDEIAALDRVLHETIRQRKLMESLLKESESRTRSLIENMPVGVVTTDDEGIIESTNPRIEQMFGYNFDELTGDHASALFSLPADFDKQNFVEQTFKKSLGKVTKLQSRRKDGDIFPVELTVNEFESVDGKRFLAMVQDITEREEAERFKQELIAMVSHDLRSPLTSVQGVVTLLGRGMYGQLNETGEQRVRTAEKSISRLLHLIDDLLDLERMQAGKLNLNQEMVHLSPVFDRSIELVYDFAQQSQLSFSVTETNLSVYADEDRLVQVVVNLLSNAIKFSPRNSTIKISAETVPNGQVVVYVSDSGPGIDSMLLDAVFDRFRQVNEHHSQHKGTGLGLAICKAIIEGHGGSIGVDSELGKGSTFWFKLPSKLPASETPTSDTVSQRAKSNRLLVQ